MEDKAFERFVREVLGSQDHAVREHGLRGPRPLRGLYETHDLLSLRNVHASSLIPAVAGMSSIDELLERDRQREEDGFPRKIRVGRMIRPGKGSKDAIVIVPTTIEEKFVHDSVPHPQAEGETGGSGHGEEGEIIGEEPVRPEHGEGTGAGDGTEAPHELEASAYELGRILTEKFQLPNLKDRGKKRSLTQYTYDITDKSRGVGHVLDKKATIRRILETNFGLQRIHDPGDIDTSELLVAPRDRVYRVLSREKDYESQALVFFVRDYSGSMEGACTQLVVAQHVLIYSWLTYQYARRIETRFVLHDTAAKEVPDFHTYYHLKTGGGTKAAAAYQLVNDLVEEHHLARDYNIYVFHGTDGDDWDTSGEKTVPQIRRMLAYVSRLGITITARDSGRTEIERYLEDSGILKQHPDLIRLDCIDENADEPRLIEGIRRLLSTEVRA